MAARRTKHSKRASSPLRFAMIFAAFTILGYLGLSLATGTGPVMSLLTNAPLIARLDEGGGLGGATSATKPSSKQDDGGDDERIVRNTTVVQPDVRLTAGNTTVTPVTPTTTKTTTTNNDGSVTTTTNSTVYRKDENPTTGESLNSRTTSQVVEIKQADGTKTVSQTIDVKKLNQPVDTKNPAVQTVYKIQKEVDKSGNITKMESTVTQKDATGTVVGVPETTSVLVVPPETPVIVPTVPLQPSSTCTSSTGKTCGGGNIPIPAGCYAATGAGWEKGARSRESGTTARECMLCDNDGNWVTDKDKTKACHEVPPDQVILPPNPGLEYTQGTKTPKCDPSNSGPRATTVACRTVTCDADSCWDNSAKDPCYETNGTPRTTGSVNDKGEYCYDGGWKTKTVYESIVGTSSPQSAQTVKNKLLADCETEQKKNKAGGKSWTTCGTTSQGAVITTKKCNTSKGFDKAGYCIPNAPVATTNLNHPTGVTTDLSGGKAADDSLVQRGDNPYVNFTFGQDNQAAPSTPKTFEQAVESYIVKRGDTIEADADAIGEFYDNAFTTVGHIPENTVTNLINEIDRRAQTTGSIIELGTDQYQKAITATTSVGNYVITSYGQYSGNTVNNFATVLSFGNDLVGNLVTGTIKTAGGIRSIVDPVGGKNQIALGDAIKARYDNQSTIVRSGGKYLGSIIVDTSASAGTAYSKAGERLGTIVEVSGDVIRDSVYDREPSQIEKILLAGTGTVGTLSEGAGAVSNTLWQTIGNGISSVYDSVGHSAGIIFKPNTPTPPSTKDTTPQSNNPQTIIYAEKSACDNAVANNGGTCTEDKSGQWIFDRNGTVPDEPTDPAEPEVPAPPAPAPAAPAEPATPTTEEDIPVAYQPNPISPDIQYFAQQNDRDCGIAAGTMIFSLESGRADYNAYLDELNKHGGLQDKGSGWFDQHSVILTENGYDVVPVSGSTQEIKNQIAAYTAQGIPVWINAYIQGENGGNFIGHHTLAIGVKGDNIILDDPYYGENYSMPVDRIDIDCSSFRSPKNRGCPNGTSNWIVNAVIPPSIYNIDPQL